MVISRFKSLMKALITTEAWISYVLDNAWKAYDYFDTNVSHYDY